MTSKDEHMSKPTGDAATYADAVELARVVAYAEARAIMLAWAGDASHEAADLARNAIFATLAESKECWHPNAQAFGTHLRGLIRTLTAGKLFRLGRRGEATGKNALAPGQHGDLPGIEVIFHKAGEEAGAVRLNEPRTMASAKALADYATSRLERMRERQRLASASPDPAKP